MTPFPAGPWVIVVGMHRSGTSAVTGALTALGLHMARPEDLMRGHESNPDHWESLTAYRINESLLDRLGGSWDAPPDLVEGWERNPEVLAAHDTATLMAEAYPESGASVWKDPRVCLLLDYWRQYLPPPVAAVLVWRPPLAVARSLHERNNIPIADGVALWERYNRAAIEGLEGLETLVVDYETVVDDPVQLVAGLVQWMDGLDGFEHPGPGWNLDEAVSTITGDLRHQTAQLHSEDDGVLLAEQRALVGYLTTLRGVHHRLPGELPGEESPWTSAVITLRRTTRWLERQLVGARDDRDAAESRRDEVVSSLEQSERRLQETIRSLEECRGQLERSTRSLDGVYRSTSWRLTQPLRSVMGKLQSAPPVGPHVKRLPAAARTEPGPPPAPSRTPERTTSPPCLGPAPAG